MLNFGQKINNQVILPKIGQIKIIIYYNIFKNFENQRLDFFTRNDIIAILIGEIIGIDSTGKKPLFLCDSGNKKLVCDIL